MHTEKQCKPGLLVSACLIGNPVRYDGRCCSDALPQKLLAVCGRIYPVCPESEGGLPCPRPPAEIRKAEKNHQTIVISKDGKNVTENFELGAQKALDICKNNGIQIAVLKSKSPSCGRDAVYDGSFSGRLIQGDGMTVRLLKQHGIKVFNEKEIREAVEYIASLCK